MGIQLCVSKYTEKRPIFKQKHRSSMSHGNPSPQPLRTTAPSNSLRLLRPSRTFTWTNVMAQPGRISALPGGGNRPQVQRSPKISTQNGRLETCLGISQIHSWMQLDAVGCWAKTCFQFSAIRSTNPQIHHAIPASNGGSYRLTASSFSCDMVPAVAPGASGRSGSGQGPSGSSRHTSCNVSSKAQRTGSLIT